jgi:hypothetical protein
MYLGCNAQFTGILEVWKGMDTYIVETNKLLCSDLCPCNLKDKNIYMNNNQLPPDLSNWTISNQIFNAINFQTCDRDVREMAFKNAVATSPVFASIKDFNPQRFYEFMARIEYQFQCSGWCQKSYYINGSERYLSKYIFTDINRLIFLI